MPSKYQPTAALLNTRAASLILLGRSNEAIELLDKNHLWQTFLQFMSHQKLITNVAWHLRHSNKKLPTETKEYCDTVFTLNLDRNQKIQASLKAITLKLNDAQIKPLLLKGGAWLAEVDSNDPFLGYRIQTDIDILVKPENLSEALTIIQSQGYEFSKEVMVNRQRSLVAAAPNEITKQLRRYRNHHHLPALINPDANCSIELHKHCVRPRFETAFNIEEVFTNAESHKNNTGHYLAMASEEQIRHWLYHDYIGTGIRARYEFPMRLYADWLRLNRPSVESPLFKEFFDTITPFEAAPDSINFESIIDKYLAQHSILSPQPYKVIARLNDNRLANIQSSINNASNRLMNLYSNPSRLISAIY